jgi:hypothetical protein
MTEGGRTFDGPNKQTCQTKIYFETVHPMDFVASVKKKLLSIEPLVSNKRHGVTWRAFKASPVAAEP